MSPTEFCRNKVIRSNSNFTVAFALLNNEKREAMEALYSYCREIDDIGIPKETFLFFVVKILSL